MGGYVLYGHFLADCPESIESPDADTAFECEYSAQFYQMIDDMTRARRNLVELWVFESYHVEIDSTLLEDDYPLG